MHRLSQVASEEGAVMVIVALALPVLILFASFAIDVGNWFEHQRHLQLQADAGALAAAGDFRYPCNATDNETIERRAKEYSGTYTETGGYNHQVGGTPFKDVHFALNSRTYFEQPSTTDPTVIAKPPCEAGMIDVKLTETDLPLFFRAASLVTPVPLINAHARVQIFQKKNVGGTLPVAVPDVNPQKASVAFIDEEHEGKVLGTRQLTREGSIENGSENLAIWTNKTEPLPIKVETGRIGMRVALSGGTSTTCGAPLVACYEAGSAAGIVFAHGFSMAGSGAQPAPPLARGVTLVPGGSCDPYFSVGSCTVGLHANVDFGPCESIAKVGAELTAVVGNSRYPMTMNKTCPAGTSITEWDTSEKSEKSLIPVPAEAGPIPVELEWAETKGTEGSEKCKPGNGNKCTGSFGLVQRAFGASNARSGPIRLAQIWEGGAKWANSFERCSAVKTSCTYAVTAQIGIKQNLLENAKSANQPPVSLRVFHEAEGNPSQTQALDCDPALSNLRKEIATGCAPEYTRNQGTSCPSPSVLWASPEPWACTALQTGGDVNQVFQGMNERVFGTANPSSCLSPNNWLSAFPNFSPSDPRVVPVFLTPFGSFSGSGNNETVPVTNFGTFYVTGWAGQGGGNTSKSICPTDDPAEPGTIVGHFIKYVDALNEGDASEEKCEFNTPTPCVAVLTE